VRLALGLALRTPATADLAARGAEEARVEVLLLLLLLLAVEV
jgi:hypothetical protein